jgi:hypothetical protein
VEARLREGCLFLSWKPASPDPAGYRLLRRSDKDPDFKILADLPAAERTFSDCAVPLGRTAVYQIQSVNARGKAGPPSPPQSVTFLPPPPAPASLTAEPGDGFVQLCWTNPPAAESPAGFRLYRTIPEEPYPRRSANAELAPGPCWVDGNLSNGQSYRYVARAVVRSEAGMEVEGPASPEIEVTPQDRVPPLPPAELVAVPGVQGVVLRWQRSPEPDLRGYYVYRRPRGASRWERITAEPLATPEFTDADPRVVPGREYFYAVSAVDNAPTPNESQLSAPAAAIALPR